MPIKIQTTGSIQEVEREIRSLEVQYEMSSTEFAAHPSIHDAVPEFDAIEWHFLLMQKRAFDEERCVSTEVFRGQSVTRTSTADMNVAEMYESVAA